MIFKIIAILILAIIIFLFIECKPLNSSDLLMTKYNSTRANEEYNVPILSFAEADEILSSFLKEENRVVTFKNDKLIYTLGHPNQKYNLNFEFTFVKENHTLYYVGCDKKISCQGFVCNVEGISLSSEKQDYQCMVKGFFILNVEGETCMFPFTTVINTNIKDTFKTTFDYKYVV